MPRLSLCMIVRDEETMLPECLRSVRGVVDEIVVLDTGSVDATAALARRAGARVLRQPWSDDFAAARNAALAAATGDWVLILDADERLGPGAKQALQAAMRSGIDCGMLPLHDATRLDASFADVVSGRARRVAPTLLPRLLRRTADLAWTGVVHESVGPWLHAAPRRVGRVDADIVHYGAVPEVREARAKDARNLHLLERRCELEPDNATAWGYLAREQMRAGEPALAREACRLGWAAARTGWEGGARPAVIQLLSLHATLLLEDDRPDEALEAIGTARAHGAAHPNLDLLEALAHERRGATGPAGDAFARARAGKGTPHTEEVIEGATGWAAWSGSGRIHAREGRHTEALACFDAALAERPAAQDIRLGRIASLAVLRPQEALAALGPELVEGARADVWVMAAWVCEALGARSDARIFLARLTRGAPVSRAWSAHLDALRALEQGHACFDSLGVPTVQGPDAATLLAAGERRAEDGDAPGAIACALAALRHDVRATDAWVLLAEVLRALGEPETACAVLGQARAVLPADAELHAVLALLHLEGGRPADAAFLARRALRVDPENALALEVLGETGVHGEGGAVHADSAITRRLATRRGAPLLSVIVPTHGRPDALLNLLDRIALCDLDRRAFEVIVVDDGSPEPVRDSGTRPFTRSILRQENAGPAAARNHALRHARGEWVLLYNDDALPEPNGPRMHLTAQLAEAGPTAIVGSDDGEDEDQPLGATNLSLPRTALDTAGGFDEAGPRDPIGEVELRYRLERHGVAFRRIPEVTCAHDAPSWETRLARREGQGREAWRAWAKHGEPRLVHHLDGDPAEDAPWSRLRAWLEGARDLEDRLTVQLAAIHRAGAPESETDRARVREATRTVANLRYQHGLLQAREGFPHGWRPPRHPRRATTSVILPNLNGFPHVQGCLATLRAHTPEPLEVIVIDNGSTDGSLEWLRRQPGVRLLEMGENVGAPAARNRGLAVASGERVLFCDNDVLFTPRWLEIMVGHLEAWPDVGMVGPMSDYVVEPQKIEEAPPGEAELDAWAAAFHARRRGRHAYTSQLILFFILFRREMVEQVGGIDESFGRWGFEDNDWALRARIAGWKLRLAQDVFIRHLGSRTARSANLDYGRFLLENWEVFKRKWGLDPALPYGTPIDVDALARQPFDPTRHYVGFRGSPTA